MTAHLRHARHIDYNYSSHYSLQAHTAAHLSRAYHAAILYRAPTLVFSTREPSYKARVLDTARQKNLLHHTMISLQFASHLDAGIVLLTCGL